MKFQKIIFFNQLRLTLLLFSLVLLVACHPRIPEEALMLDSESLEQRQLQTRVFQTDDEAEVLAACSALLQDLGFNIDESECKLGVIVGSKDRSAVSAGQVIGSIFVALLTGAAMPVDKNQKMRACIVTKPIGDERRTTAVRVTFQRIVWDTQGKITKRECLTDPKIYQEFFEKLSKSLFLEAHEIL